MAIVGTQDEDEKNKLALPTTSSSPNAHAAYDAAQGKPYEGASGAGFIGGTGGQGATTGVANATSTGAASPNPGGYTNLSQYLAVNQGSGATTGQAAENVVQQSADAAKGAQNAFNTSGMNDINAATTAAGVNQGVLGNISGGQANVDQATLDKINAGGYNYTPPAGLSLAGLPTESKDNLDAMIKTGKDASSWSYGGPTDFSKVGYGGPTIDQITTQYGGPKNTSEFTGQTAAQQQAALAANNTVAGNVKNAGGGHAGVSALLKQAYQQPQYSAGENNLDAFLAGGTEGGKAALAQAGGVGQGVSDNYSGISNTLNLAGQKGVDTAKATNKTYQDAINSATTNSDATRGSYNLAAKGAQDRTATAKAAAMDAAKRAQAEEDRRAAEAAKIVQQQEQPPPEPTKNPTQDIPFLKGTQEKLKALSNTGESQTAGRSGPLANVVNYVQPRVDAVTKPIAKASAALNPVVNAVKNNITPATIATGGLNKIASVGKKLHFAHGGEVPSYAKLVAKLRGKR